MRVIAHVHPRGADDQALSQKRADAVRAWLVQWGIEEGRIEARGLGSAKLLVPKGRRGAREVNDRVEIIIVERE